VYKRQHKYIYYYFFERLEFLQAISIGAATQFLTTQMLKKLNILLPSKELMLKFSKITDPVFEQIQTLQQQNTQLRQIRDRLLPRLISGKLEVKEENKT
jgi:type I restriction enzyme S subunit